MKLNKLVKLLQAASCYSMEDVRTITLQSPVLQAFEGRCRAGQRELIDQSLYGQEYSNRVHFVRLLLELPFYQILGETDYLGSEYTRTSFDAENRLVRLVTNVPIRLPPRVTIADILTYAATLPGHGRVVIQVNYTSETYKELYF